MIPKETLELSHPTGETKISTIEAGSIPVDTYGGRVHVEWNAQAAVTPLGQLPFFIEFLKTADLFEPWVDQGPLSYTSPNAPAKRDVLGTLFLSVLAGHHRYSHISSIRCDTVNPILLGMSKVVSEDSVRRGLKNCDEEESRQWLQSHLKRCYEPLLYEPWILDIDTTVKLLYGHQEGAVVAYNPHKPGRPSQTYHSYFAANIRLALDVDVQPGNQTAATYSQPGLWKLIDEMPIACRPRFIRGDCAWGVETVMNEAEERGQAYLFKLRQTKNVKKLIGRIFESEGWSEAGQGWEGLDSCLQLSGWSRSRRVVVLRRLLKGDLACQKTEDAQMTMGVEFGPDVKRYEYAVLVTSLRDEVFSLAQHYRDRGDVENNFDELKNQWGWGGYTTHDIKRCRIMARTTALIYNWWSLFVRLAIPEKHAEAITSRPLLLHAVGKKTEHAGQTKITISSMHRQTEKVQKMLKSLSAFLQKVKNAEQLNSLEKWRWILSRIFRYFLKGKPLRSPPLLPQPA